MNTAIAWLTGLLKGQGQNLEELGVKELMSVDDWQNVLTASKDAPQFVFKHSTTCPISAAAHGRVADYMRATDDAVQAPLHLVKVIESRPVSNQIAVDTGVQHQSPQLILLMNGAAVWNASHGSITVDAIHKALEGTSS